MSADYVLQLGHVSRTFDGRLVLDDINLAFLRGARIGVIGHNGSGKSTLLRVLAGVETEYEGARWAADDVTHRLPVPGARAHARHGPRRTSRRPSAETRALLKRFDELNEKLGGGPRRRRDAGRARRARRASRSEIEATRRLGARPPRRAGRSRAGLPGPGDADVATLSGGERRRVALCKILLAAPGRAAARRADQPPRRRRRLVAGAPPRRLRGHGDRHHARPLLPRQRRGVDARDGATGAASRTRATTPPTSSSAPRASRPRTRQTKAQASSACSASSSGSARTRGRAPPRARRASRTTSALRDEQQERRRRRHHDRRSPPARSSATRC